MLKNAILFILALSPLPFASARPVWQMLWVCLICLMIIIWVLIRIKNKQAIAPGSHLSKLPLIPIVCWGLFILWGFLQSFDLGLLQLIEPANTKSDTVNALWTNLGTLSVTPSRTLVNALYFTAHLLFFVMVFSIYKRRRMAHGFFQATSMIVTLYALYGFTVYILGNDTILWYDKWAYKNSLTSTFVNRNSFATYAGMGLICTLTWGINYFRSTVTHGLTSDTRLQDFINRFMEKGWLFFISGFILMSALMLTGSRAGMTSTIIGLAVFLSLWQMGGTSALKINKGYFFAAAALLILGAMALSGDQLQMRLMADASDDQRFKAYPLIWQAIMERPLTGYGLGSFIDVFRQVRDETVRVFFDRGHSDYLELMLTAGIPMTLALLLVPTSIMIILVQALRKASDYRLEIIAGISVTVIVGLHAILDFSLQMPAVSYMYTAIMAVSLAVAVRSKA